MAIIRRNSFNWDGAPDTAVTIERSSMHGDPFDSVDSPGVTYDQSTVYAGAAALRLDNPSSSNGMSWTDLSLADCALRVYINRGSSESGNIWWSPGPGTASLGAAGDVTWDALTLEDALPADTWCRVEATRQGTTGTLRVWSTDPASTGAPDAETSGTIDGSTITQWWLEHLGDAIWIDEWSIADTADAIGPVIEALRTNTCDGPTGAQITTSNSGGSLGDAWSGADAGTVYTDDAYTGSGAILLPSGMDSGSGVVWGSLPDLTDMAVRGYLKRDADAQDGHVWWASGTGGCSLSAEGGLDWYGVGLSLPSGTIPADTWVRIEARREGSTGYLAVWSSDPQASIPDVETSGTITTDVVTQWWWERFGTGAVRWDELALNDAAAGLGPADERVVVEASGVEGEHTGWGLPMYLLTPGS
ncbi:hypothetical protein [Streptomonospora litoralis]|uniref:Uncharacterized protein n=1 Tax=Streptomonospora litoralis TaxID=2498135 RepID=A0A4V0ZJG6_9ACTN|nr:hypothetical protein [Streptomonospora litoralis]QBI53412.1 hypothetical protein EKD16_08090 [Streptomonospora litoralis]